MLLELSYQPVKETTIYECVNKRELKKLAETYEVIYKEIYEELPLWRKKAIDEGEDYEKEKIAKKVIEIVEKNE